MSPDVVALASGALLAGGIALVSRSLARISESREGAVASFAGGVSLAFVLLQLLVELAEGAGLHHAELPMHSTALLILGGAAVTFAAHAYNARREESWASYAVALAPQVLYGALVGAALDGELHESWRAFAVFWFAMVLHVGVTEHHLAMHFPREHRGAWRLLTVGSPFVGAVVWTAAAPTHATFHVLLAVVAGATILGVFRDELPDERHVRVSAFFAGIVVFGTLMQLRWRL